MQNLIYHCPYCNLELYSVKSFNAHKNECEKNPNKECVPLSHAENKLLAHYYYLYYEEYQKLSKELKSKFKALGYNNVNSSRLAKKELIEILTEKDEAIQKEKGVWECPICHRHIVDMGAHIEHLHEVSWADFIDSYGWSEGRVFFSDTHHARLSKNKKHFYNDTDEGKKAKELLSEKYSGNKNPACRDEVRLKISQSRRGAHMTLKNKQAISKSMTSGIMSANAVSRGYSFFIIQNNKEIRFRSKCEYLIYLMFCYYNINVEYEPFKIEYYDPSCEYLRNYLVDFVSGNRLFEVKPSDKEFELEKYLHIQNQLQKSNKKLEFLTPLNFFEVFKIPESKQKPLNFFYTIMSNNIIEGNCKIQLPHGNNRVSINSNFITQLGGMSAIKKGENLYENKKRSLGIE